MFKLQTLLQWTVQPLQNLLGFLVRLRINVICSNITYILAFGASSSACHPILNACIPACMPAYLPTCLPACIHECSAWYRIQTCNYNKRLSDISEEPVVDRPD